MSDATAIPASDPADTPAVSRERRELLPDTARPSDARDEQFRDLAAFAALPRVSGLVLSPDGSRLVTSVATPSPSSTKYVTALWEIDPTGSRPAHRLTRSAPGESNPAFLPNGDLLFSSCRPDPLVKEPDDDVPALWLLPSGGGEARRVASRPGGIRGIAVARDAGIVVADTVALPGTLTAEEDDEARKARKDTGVGAILHTAMPVRYWDHDLGPGERRLLTTQASLADVDEPVELRDLTPTPGPALEDESFIVTPDGRGVITGWRVPLPAGDLRSDLVRLDLVSGERRVLVSDPVTQATFNSPAVSPDGRWLACVRTVPPSWDDPPDLTLWLVDLTTGDSRDLTPQLDLWPAELVFAPGSDELYMTADEQGERPAFRIDLGTGDVTRLTSRGAFSSLCPAPDGRALLALRSSYAHPPQPVRIDLSEPGAEPRVLPAPGAFTDLPGRVEEVRTTAPDGTPLRATLVLPRDACADRPAPLVLWIHGGPLSSWNDWSWRWCPHVLAAHGYAVLLPDPALSTGYGRAFVARGWGQWGGTPYTDLMAVTDAALQRDDLDETRTAAMGGSYGGYMANWVAGHTDRFRAIVTHASLWALDQFQGTTDHPAYWAREWAHSDERRERYDANSPHLHADAIRTPMLVIHGDKDYRVPIGEGLRLWYDLVRREVPAQFLYFPDENHWVLSPGNAQVWYDTVLTFLDHHVLGKALRRPRLL